MRRYRSGPSQELTGQSNPGPPRPPPHNLPCQLTSFIGRGHELAEVERLLGTARLVTLTGPGGCGKTRLALEAAAAVLPAYPDGAWLVELASLADPTLVPQAIASVLGVREEPGRLAAETLTDHLRPRQLLLVLDNCEHLVDACARLVEHLLRACPELRVLATSREALRVPGEVAWLVPSLSLPAADDLPLPELAKSSALSLFAERANAVASTFTLTEGNASAVARVCRRLDGMPLAIELAAARANVLSVAQIAARLDDALQLLAGGSRTALPRHQALRATIDWSYGLLSEAEQALVRQLAVFAGSFTLEAVEAVVCGADRDEADALALLSRLVDKSLVVVIDQGTAARYRLLETVHQYAWDKLLASGQADDARRRHADFVLGRAEAIAPKINTRDRARWLAELDKELSNLRVALSWARDTGNVDMSLRLAGVLWWYWLHRGYWKEGRGWLEQAIADWWSRAPNSQTDSARPDPDLARATVAAGWLAFTQGDHAAARSRLEESVALYRALGDVQGLAYPLSFLAVALAYLRDHATARRAGEESVALFRGGGDRWGLAAALLDLGIVAAVQHDYPSANRFFDESAALFRHLGDGWGLSLPLRHAGYVAFHQGNLDRALALYQESLALCREFDEKWLVTQGLEAVAIVAGTRGAHDRAARLFGAAERLREVIGAALVGSYRADYDGAMAAARAGLGEAAFAAAWAAGRAMDLDEVLALALAPEVGTPATPARPTADALSVGRLTRREREVAALVARGLTNRQIAERLFVTEKTAEAHVGHALAKLDFTSRAQLAVWAVEHGLPADANN